jgi:hypothetical protein
LNEKEFAKQAEAIGRQNLTANLNSLIAGYARMSDNDGRGITHNPARI